MTTDIYKRLAEHLDNLPGGYPATDSGIELRILRRLFTPQDAELAMHLTLIPEEPRVIARRAGIPVSEARRRLRHLESKGLIYCEHQPGQSPKYQAIHFVIGIFEFQVGKMDPDLVEDLDDYLPLLINHEVWEKSPQMRTIPVGESIDPMLEVMSYERAETLVSDKTKFSVAPCICREKAHILEHGCNKPQETCLMTDAVADYYVRNGLGREISKTEAFELLVQAEEAGLVLQPSNNRQGDFICMCCGCCCGILTNLKRHPQPATLVSTPFRAVVDVELCDGCGDCLLRCQMEAIDIDTGVSVIRATHCIGCGLCVTTCPNEALHLERKPEAAQSYVPKDIVETSIKLGQARGKLGIPELIKLQLKSSLDRMLAPREH